MKGTLKKIAYQGGRRPKKKSAYQMKGK